MQPIEVKITGFINQTPKQISQQFLDINRWSEFEGYSFLPGVKSVQYETQTPNLIGTRFRVQNTDGSSHTEELIEWDEEKIIKLKFQNFDSALKNLASHFIETWEYTPVADGTQMTRRMILYPIGLAGWLMLLPISIVMKKAFEKSYQKTKG